MASRREFIKAATASLLAQVGCSKRSEKNSDRMRAEEALLVRDKPARIDYFPMKRNVLSVDDLKRLLTTVRPDSRWSKYPIVYVYHSLRFWGRFASFNDIPFVNSVVSKRGWGAGAFAALVDNAVFLDLVSAFGTPMLVPSRFGVEVLTTSDMGWGQEWASTHPGKYEQVMAELDVLSTQKLTITTTKEFTLRDAIVDTARRVHHDVECEWSAIGLSRYLESDNWQNRFGQAIDFDIVAQWLLDREPGKGACCGTHVLFALSTLCQLNRNGARKITKGTYESMELKLRGIASSLSYRIGSDGSWPANWSNDGNTDRQLIGFGKEMTKVLVTGHHLEWMSMRQPEDRPKEAVLEQAIRFLLESITDFSPLLRSDWFFYLPISHAVRAICKLQGVEPSSFGQVGNNVTEG